MADARGFRVALVADELVNPAPGGVDGLAVLETEGWGAIQLPPASYPDDVAVPLLEEIADTVAEFLRNGYDVVLVGECDRAAAALERAGVAVPPAIRPSSAEEMRAFLVDVAGRRLADA